MSQAIAGLSVNSADEASRIYSKVTWRLIPFLFICYVAAYLDRVNVGFAKLQMLADLQFSETVYGLGAGIFFIGYFIFEVPSNIILHKVGARVWIARVMLTWAVISGAMMFVTTPLMFYVLRFLLGVAEAGLFPGVILYLTYWYPAERRGKVIALFMTGIPIAGVIGGPLSGWIMQAMSGVSGLAGWQWMFLIEAIPSVILGVAVLFYLDDGIEHARWLSSDEKALLARNVAEDQKGVQSHHLRDGFTNPLVWLLSGIYFCFIMGLYGIGFWLPTLIKNAGVASPLVIGFLTVLPYGAAAVAMVLVSRQSDAKRERRWHLIIPGLIGALGWLVTIQYGTNASIAVAALTVATMGVMTTLSQFWCLPTAMLAGAAAATGIAVINSIGNLAGFVSPYVIGWIIDQTHSTDLGIYTLAASICIGSLLVLTLPKQVVNRRPRAGAALTHERRNTMLDSVDNRVSIYQPEQKGLIFPEIPQFNSFAEEREYRKQHLVAATRAFALHGFDYGFAGHLTVRDPERPELYWTNPMCVHFSQVRMSNLVLADHEGNVVEGKHAINRAGFVLHGAVHEAHPDVIAMCHAHTTYGTAWCATGRPLDMISQDAACFYNNHAVIGASAGAVAVERESGYSVAQEIGKSRAILHQNHGLLTTSRHSIDDAAFWFIALERCCQVQLLVEASGVTPQTVSQKTAEYSREHVGNDFIGWLHFQTLYDQIAATQPDMFD